MSSDEILFCDKLEKLLYLTMKDLLPSSISELKEKLFLVPSVSKKLLCNGVPGCHQVQYASTCDTHVLGVHVDSQN